MASSTFGFASGNLRKLLALPRYVAGALHARSVERDPKLWVIGSAFGPADGALAFYRAAASLPDKPRLVWLSKSAAETRKARDLGRALVEDIRTKCDYVEQRKVQEGIRSHFKELVRMNKDNWEHEYEHWNSINWR